MKKGALMEYKTISEMFLGTTNEFSTKVLYSYKKNSEWIGIKGSDVRSVVKNLSADIIFFLIPLAE